MIEPSNARIRRCSEADAPAMLAIINEAAEAYRGVIPADCFHDPYMSAAEFQAEVDAGVTFVGYEIDGTLAGIMGMQSVRNVDLIRHAYVHSSYQGRGIGHALLSHLRVLNERPILVGTWADANWAIGFYERHGFQLVPASTKAMLLRAYWTVSNRQIDTSVVLATPGLGEESANRLVSCA